MIPLFFPSQPIIISYPLKVKKRSLSPLFNLQYHLSLVPCFLVPFIIIIISSFSPSKQLSTVCLIYADNNKTTKRIFSFSRYWFLLHMPELTQHARASARQSKTRRHRYVLDHKTWSKKFLSKWIMFCIVQINDRIGYAPSLLVVISYATCFINRTCVLRVLFLRREYHRRRHVLCRVSWPAAFWAHMCTLARSLSGI